MAVASNNVKTSKCHLTQSLLNINAVDNKETRKYIRIKTNNKQRVTTFWNFKSQFQFHFIFTLS